MSDALFAGLVGLGAGSTLLVGAIIAWFFAVPKWAVAGVMAFGAGVLISTLAYELVEESSVDGGLLPTAGGFIAGAVIYVVADVLLARYGARHRRQSVAERSGDPSSSSGGAIAIGALLDGIPESIVLGLSVAGGGSLSLPVLIAVAVSNIPEGLGSSAGMKSAGRGAGTIFGVWGSIAVASGIASLLGYLFVADAGADVIAFVTTIAAGGLLAMVCNTMIPEAFDEDRAITGLLATLGFLLAFVLHAIS